MNINKNNLIKQSSPYLRQHADNPVHWQPWNKAALEQAKSSNKPILLSIGYSACHWCHVMAHESFADIDTAKVMNNLFINIKVDKEERPDLDKIYQNAHSLLAERAGGWPLTVFLTPDTHMPIFAGTYFPSEAKHGLPSFISLLHHIDEIWKSRKTDVEQQSNALRSTYQRIYESSRPQIDGFSYTVIDIARSQIEKQFDSINGGFSGAPKFPHPDIIEFALKHWRHSKNLNQPDPRILHTAIHSLQKMANGGVFDHLGGGFCRYSTDDEWVIPHFEKMLYDNGPLLSLYSQAWRLNHDPTFYNAACETANWVIREMQSSDGGYYAAQDADSEGSEGKFFVWTTDELNKHLDKAATQLNIKAASIDLFKTRFGFNRSENFEGRRHLHGYVTEVALAEENHIEPQALSEQFRQIRQYLFQQRDQRIHPETDTKVICAWNGLMIHGMAKAGRLLQKPEFTESAINAAYFIKNNCWHENRLFASYKDGDATLNAYLDDYAFLIYGLLELLQNQWHDELYNWALQLADQLIADFEDNEYGGFYFTSHHHEDLIQRLKSFSDDAIPSGNAIAALVLNRLGHLCANETYITAAENCLKSSWAAINNAPISHCALLSALHEIMSPPGILIIRSLKDDSWQKQTQQYYLADTLVYTIPAQQLLHATLGAKASTDTDIAYPCSGKQCAPAIKKLSDLKTYLRNNSYRVLE